MMKKLFMSKEISYYSLYSIFTTMFFETSIFFMYLSKKGLSYSEFSFIMSIQAVSVFLFEYITGVFADKYSRKGVLVFSTLCFISGEMLFVISNNILLFIFGIVLISLGVASRSGVDYALIYDKLVEMKKIDDFDDLMSSLGSIMLITSAIACTIGSFLFKYDIHIPFLGTIGFYIISIIFLVKIKEPHRENKETSAKKLIIKSILFAAKTKFVLGIILLSIIIFPCYHILNWIFQPYLKVQGIPIEYFGIFYTLITIFQSIGTKLSSSLNKKITSKKLLWISSFFIVFGFLLMSSEISWTTYLVPVIMGISFGVFYTINNIAINKEIESDIRASLLSLQHASTKVLQMFMFIGMGFLMDVSPLRINLIYLSAFLLIALGLIFIIFKSSFMEYKKSLED